MPALAGANLTLEQVGSFSENMTSGRGFIALAANIFGRWTPVGSYLASLLFGFAEALEIRLQTFAMAINIPPQFFLMLPYLLALVALTGVAGRVRSPAGLGKTVAGMRKVRHRGLEKVAWMFTFAAAAYNMVRLRNLRVQAAAA